jgi:glutamyl-tRNA synthetase
LSSDLSIQEIVKRIALKNAVEYGGKAKYDVVISKVIGLRPDLRQKIGDVIPIIKKTVEEVNALGVTDQRKMASELISVHQEEQLTKQKEVLRLPPLRGAILGEVVTRFPPEPNGYPHIGHAKAAIIDHEYARIYKGKLILRFDDTNPLNERLEYYDAIKAGLEWLGIEPDIVKNTSDDIELLHTYGKRMVTNGAAYVCTCRSEEIHSMRARGVPCECRTNDHEILENLERFYNGSFEQNEAIIRFMGEMSHSNTALRDPTMFRIIDANHPMLGTSVRVFPTYDFAAPVEDSLDGVTHAMRTKEYELRNPLYYAVLKSLNLREPILFEFSRLEFEGLPVSKRMLKPLVEGGLVHGWDDPRLPTLAALRKRGIMPEAIHRFILSLGITLADTKPPFKSLEAYNRKLLDKISLRLFFVKHPVEVKVINSKADRVRLRNHPTVDLGTRMVSISDGLYLDQADAESVKPGQEIRLMELYNIRIEEVIRENGRCYLKVTNTGPEMKTNIPKVQLVAKGDMIPFTVLVPDKLFIGNEYNQNNLHTYNGIAESFVSKIPLGTHVQFVRFGFCRLDANGLAIYTHD